MIKTIATCLILAASTSATFAQSPAFTPDSLGELRRVFGTTPRPPAPTVAVQRTHDLAVVRDLLAAPSQSAIQTFISLNDGANPHAIDSISLLSAVAQPTSDPVYLLLWHQIALDATAIDFSSGPNGSKRYQEQPGPPRTARALALVHLAMFEAANLFDRRYGSYLSETDSIPNAGANRDAAIVEAAYKTMLWLYPGLDERASFALEIPATLDCNPAANTQERLSLTAYHQCSIQQLGADKPEVIRGQEIGALVALLVQSNRLGDKSDQPEPTFDKDSVVTIDPTNPTDPTRWAIDPVSGLKIQLGGRWANVTPFAPGIGPALYPTPPSQVLHPKPDPATKLSDLPTYEVALDYGVESRFPPGTGPANHDGLFIAQYWAYDGTANLCAPPRLYNQIALAALGDLETNPAHATATALDTTKTVDVARYFALANVAMNDAAITAWGAKYKFQFARPITYIRAAQDQPVPATVERTHPLWLPVGAQTTNAAQPFNATPPFPAYPSGHAVFGGALFGIMRQFIKPAAAFGFRSDEFNGHNRDAFNYVRCRNDDMGTDKTTNPTFCGKRQLTLDCAERENADSRVFMGVHWLFDADDGITLGNKVAKQAFTLFQRTGSPDAPTTFSLSNPGAKRADLICAHASYPLGWEAKFGDLKTEAVN